MPGRGAPPGRNAANRSQPEERVQDVDKDFVVVGEILKPHGVRGELRVVCHAQSPFLFDELVCVYLRPGPRTPRPDPLATLGPGPLRPGQVARARRRPPARPRRVEVTSWREHKDLVLLTLAGVDDRDAAEALRGHEVLARKADLPDPGGEELFLHEIQGLTVLLDGGERLGEVRDIMLPGGQEVWTIVTDDGREVLFPVAEEFLVAVDPQAGTVTIAPPPGLLELYLDGGGA